MFRNFAVLFSILCSASFSSIHAELIGHWTFDDADVNADTVMDVSGNGLHGTKMNGGPMTGVPGAPGFGQAADFAGGSNNEDNHYVDLSEHAAAFAELSEGTLAAWVKPVTADEAGGENGHLTDVLTIFAASDSSQGSAEMRWFVHTAESPFSPGGPGGNIAHGSLVLGTRGSDFNDHIFTEVADDVSLLDGEWNHVAVTVDGDNSGNMFINGQEVDFSYVSGDAISFMGDLLPDGPTTAGIGRNKDSSAGGGQWFYHGLIDDLRIYDEALDATAIQGLLTPTGGPGAIARDLVAYYSFDDGEGDILKEGSGNGSDGELFGFDFADESNWADGQIDGALHFDGVDDFVIAPEYQLAEDALTVALWANADTAAVWASLVKNWAGPPGQFHFGLGPAPSDTLNVFITDGTGTAFNAGQDVDSFPLEEWQHVAFVADPETGLVTQYRNGEVVSEVDYDGTFTDAPINEALGIGVKPNATGDGADEGVPAFWDGLLDDLGVWTRALSADEITEIFQAGLAGTPILGIGAGGTALRSGDADQDLDFDQLDLVKVQIAAKYLTGQAATWGDGDWNGAPGGTQGEPPAGDGFFNQLDIIAALGEGIYLTGPYGALAGKGEIADAQTSLVYDAGSGELRVDAPAGKELTSINITSAAARFTGDKPAALDGAFDNFAGDNVFKATFGGSFGSISFGNILPDGLSEEDVTADLSAVGSLAGGGDLGEVDLVYIPEPATFALALLGSLGLLRRVRRSRS